MKSKVSHLMYSPGNMTIWFSDGSNSEDRDVTAYFKKYDFGGSLFTEHLYALLWFLKISKQDVELLTNADGEISGFTFQIEGSPVSLFFEPFVRLSYEGHDDPAKDNLIGAEDIADRFFNAKYMDKEVCPF